MAVGLHSIRVRLMRLEAHPLSRTGVARLFVYPQASGRRLAVNHAGDVVFLVPSASS